MESFMARNIDDSPMQWRPMVDQTENVTILILSLNRPQYLREALISAIGQTHKAREIVILDNGSNDNVKKNVQDLFSTCVRWEGADETRSPHWNVARGLIMVRSAYVHIMHDDDVLEPDFLKRGMEFLIAHPEVAALGCNGPIIYDDGKDGGRTALPRFDLEVTWFKKPAELAMLYSNGHLIFPSIIYRTDAIGPGMVHEEFGKVADGRLLFDVLDNGPIVHLDLLLYRYRQHSNQDSTMLPELQYRMKDRFLIDVSKDDPVLGRKVSRNVYRLQTRRYLERCASALLREGFKAMIVSIKENAPAHLSISGLVSFVPFAFRKSRLFTRSRG